MTENVTAICNLGSISNGDYMFGQSSSTQDNTPLGMIFLSDFLRNRGGGDTNPMKVVALEISSRCVSIDASLGSLILPVVEKNQLGNSSEGVGVLLLSVTLRTENEPKLVHSRFLAVGECCRVLTGYVK